MPDEAIIAYKAKFGNEGWQSLPSLLSKIKSCSFKSLSSLESTTSVSQKSELMESVATA